MSERLIRIWTFANVTSLLALVFAMGGGACAIASSAAPNCVIHGCYQRNSGILRVISGGAKCSSSARAITWNQQGPRGPQDAKGPKGDKGDLGGGTGPAGGDLTGSYPNPTLRPPSLAGVVPQPPPPAAVVDCGVHALTFCGDPSAGSYWNNPSSGGLSFAGVFVDSLGFVHLQGYAQKVGSPTPFAFVLPDTDRPSAVLTFTAADYSNGGFTQVTSFPGGKVGSLRRIQPYRQPERDQLPPLIAQS